ncbi:MAG: GNAT family N-acetyltransferase [Caldilineaceae bacterium SB0662_bin_9]|uniref:GNAT family N-acetyltransferase n=1 Tax=Caldilineaceae bacterium SB0662_bin_9 TaxID=2605258 RepID=A0A6B1DWK6_9CHLR|nr:GNAT family N-acetyltransferase [Caldilineaceae bacterium]MYD90744.1 GNAT family N-acetyltransferase [Caldilineaceae bacterium SB0662_bin_9]
MLIRDFRFDDSDYQTLRILTEKIYPDEPTSVETLRWDDDSRPKVWWRKRVAEVDGKFAALGTVGEPFWSLQEGKVHLSVEVDPDYLNRGIGTRLFADLEALAHARGPVRRLITGTQEDKTAASDFLRERGFEVAIREPISELDLPAFDETPFVHKIQQAEASGIRLVSLADLAREYHNWQERHWQLDTAIMQDVPTPDPFSPRTLETFVRQHIGNPGFSPDVTHVAVHGGEWVGISELYIDPSHPEVGGTGLTGVTRPWRRKGLATALKLKVLHQARTRGVRRVITDNEENNPMFQINLMLGFKAKPAWLGWQLNLSEKD